MKKASSSKIIYGLFLAVLVLYPLRHVGFGVDLWDGGYNYANFRYPGTEYMDSMWFFATWISTEVGSLLMRLPFGGTMLGMNVYTGLIVSLLAATGFLFCTKILQLPTWLAFLGELASCGLCWAPTSVLYNYLTFLFLMFGMIFLYQGLTSGRDGFLVAAGVMLGLNVGVRFSNLVQMGLILAVWVYCLLKKEGWKGLWRKTFFCVAGYGAALGLFLLWMGIRYGWSNYFDGIIRLFAMTEVAEDYAPSGMLTAAFRVYFAPKNSYWFKRFGLALAVGTGACLIAPRGKGWLVSAKKIFCLAVTAGLFIWLLTHLFVYPDFAMYDSIEAPCVMLLLLSLVVAVAFMLRKGATAEERLLAVLEILAILLTSLGGNNVVYYNINNMFLTLPFLMAMLWKFWQDRGNVGFYALKSIVSALVLLVVVLSVRFGVAFVYEEAAGGRAWDAEITEIPVLKGMRTNGQKARELTELYAFLDRQALLDRKYILYGGVPGLSYYMGVAPALNVWGDLRSYTPDVMYADLGGLRKGLDNGGQAPVIIMEADWADYMEFRTESDTFREVTAVQKLELLQEFMKEYGYGRSYESGKYVLYEKNL